MYIKSLNVSNLAAIQEFNYSFQFNSNGNPLPIVIVGKNGTGKTLLLTNILDCLIELKRSSYNKIVEVGKNDLYKLSSKSYIRENEAHSIVQINLDSKLKGEIEYFDFMTQNVESSADILREENLFSKLNWSTIRESEGFEKSINVEGCRQEFDENIFLYFPVHRYYEPSWVNKGNGNTVEFSRKENYVKQNLESIIQENILVGIETWLLDVILDKMLYEMKTGTRDVLNRQTGEISKEEFIYYEGKNTEIQNQLNKLLTIIYGKKYEDLESARFGISNKDIGRRVSVIIKRNGQDEYTISPTFFHLSSGESMLIAIFLSILKAQDSKAINKSLEEIEGIVVIDEIDSHLHIALAKEVLPLMLKSFPKVQFILSSHSPFFLVGMDKEFKEDWQMVDMNKGMSIELNNQGEIEEAYRTFIEGFEETKESLTLLEEKLTNIQRTLIITEGKTDWKHFKKALEYFKSLGQFNDLNIEFLEFENEIEMGDSQLETLLKQHQKIKKVHKIIGIFDRDTKIAKRYCSTDFEDLGNNVFAMGVPIPEFRIESKNLCLEMLYEDEILKIPNEEGKRIFLSSEFNGQTSMHNEMPNVLCRNITQLTAGKIDRTSLEEAGVIDNGIVDIAADGKVLSLSKNEFANDILNGHSRYEIVDFKGFKKLFEILKEIERIPLR